MLRLILIVVLIAATASARHAVKKVRRNQNVYETCYGKSSPFHQCEPNESDYPAMVSLARTINLADAKRILLAGNTIEDLCDETRQSIDCFKNQLKRASPKCVQVYGLSSEKINDMSSLRTLLCETEVIKAIRNNLDCILTMDMIKFGEKCLLPNIYVDCSQVESSEEYTAKRECYSKKYRPDCNVETVLACGVTKVFHTCGEDASDLVALIGNAVFERFPICPANRPYHHLAKMLKFFKK